jgi:hypothetical protein
MGGLAPPLTGEEVTLDSSSLSREQAAEIADLANRALDEQPNAMESTASMPDAAAYELQIESSGQNKSILATDGNLPPAVAALIQRIRQLGRAK